ncbi:MAG: membrane integrity-associated transporter subunit PqiC [Desulfosarcina sp.]|nr:membrane integrity-associated transporter subunit PqiC [Desulfobacterales bacterium]
MKNFATEKLLAVIVPGLLILVGCVNLGPGTVSSTRLYVLAPLAASEAAEHHGALKDVTLGVGPLIFPEYLNRPQIVTRIANNEIGTAVFANWAEPLQRIFERVLAENLALLLGNDAVYTHPWRSTLVPTYRIVPEVIRFDAEPKGDAVLSVRWEVIDARGQQVIPRKKTVVRQAVREDDDAAVVTAMSRALADFSRKVADEVAALN